MADRVGQRLGNYRLVRLLGQGGFAEVYLGEHIHLDTPAAIKVLHTQLDSEDVEQFHIEARTVARLIHPHIVRVLDYGVTETIPFLVMDYAPHSTLRKRHPKGTPLPVSTVASYVTQLADALQYAHEQKVIHRDVKPENMLLGRRYEVLLSDFGIAQVAKSSRYYSTQGLQDLAGTITYMAPEQIQAQACPNSDQYSLGVVVYEWLSGARPFQGTFTEVAVKHTLAPPPSLRKLVPALSAEIEEVVMKALDKEPTRRFASVQDFAIALQQACQQEPEPPGQPQGSTLLFPTILAPSSDIAVSPDQSAVQKAALRSDQDVAATIHFTAPDLPSTTALGLNEQPSSSVETPALDQLLASPETSPLPRRSISRRTLLQGLAGVALAGVLGGGIVLLRYARGANNPATSHSSVIRVGTTLFTYRGHSDWVWSATWSPDGRRRRGRPVGSVSLQRATIRRCRSGTQPLVITFTPTLVILIGCGPWRGRPMASASPQQGATKRCRSGMPQMVAMSIRFAAMQLLSTPWRGHPTANTLPRPVPMERYKSGTRPMAFTSIPFNRIPHRSGRWHGRLMAGASLRHATIKRCRSGMSSMGITFIFITAIATSFMP